MSTEVVFTPAAAKIVKSDVTAFKSDGKRYASYVTEMDVTLETVADHVAAFRNAFKASNPKADGDTVKAYATKVRNGLNRQLGKSTEKKDPSGFYLTTEGVATLSAMDSDEMLKAILAEIENRSQIAA